MADILKHSKFSRVTYMYVMMYSLMLICNKLLFIEWIHNEIKLNLSTLFFVLSKILVENRQLHIWQDRGRIIERYIYPDN